MQTAVQTAALVAQAREGRTRAVARLISLVESAVPGDPLSREVSAEVTAALPAEADRCRVIGLTGAPGVGKSTVTSGLVAGLRARDRRVAVLAVDPSSPFSGGALLGDRIRMREHALDPGVYVRSMASRGHLGGLSVAAPQALRVLTAAGFDDVLVETVGVGQSEVEIAARVDSTVVLLAPGAGDETQAAKAGVLEIGDLFVLNKADRDGADAAVRDLENMIRLGGPREPGEWRPPVLRCVGVTGTGVPELLAALDAHHDWALRSGALHRRRARRAALEVETIVLAVLRQRIERLWARTPPDPAPDDRASGDHGVAGAGCDPYVAADRLLAELG